jgi:uncharacterized protein (DUF2164 family)
MVPLRADTAALLSDVRACRLCAGQLPHGPRPVLQLHPSARILIAAQAPGRKVHESGVPFDDASGDRLRDWLGVTNAQFYDPALFAILPMGFCYPGQGRSGDRPPRPECAPRWRGPLLAAPSAADAGHRAVRPRPPPARRIRRPHRCGPELATPRTRADAAAASESDQQPLAGAQPLVRAGGRAGPAPARRARAGRISTIAPHEQRDRLMPIELSKEARTEAIQSIERYFQEHMDERIGNIAAGALLNFFVEEIGPVIYNRAVADVQERLQARVLELDIEVHEDEFRYWRKFDAAKKAKR